MPSTPPTLSQIADTNIIETDIIICLYDTSLVYIMFGCFQLLIIIIRPRVQDLQLELVVLARARCDYGTIGFAIKHDIKYRRAAVAAATAEGLMC